MNLTPTVREINGSSSTKTFRRRAVAPPVDVFESEDELLVLADVPGVSSAGIDLSIEGATLTLHATKAKAESDWPALARECDDVDFATTLRIPAGIDTTLVTAETKNGTLVVHLPKSAAAKPRKIPVR